MSEVKIPFPNKTDNERLAALLVERLNTLCTDPEVRKMVWRLMSSRIDVSKEMADHPTIQVNAYGGAKDHFKVGMLGILNGLCGTIINDGSESGYIEAELDDNYDLTHFILKVTNE